MRWTLTLEDADTGLLASVAAGGVLPELEVPYAYGLHWHFAGLDGRSGLQSLEALRAAVADLGTAGHRHEAVVTPGGAGAACAILLDWAEQAPDARWRVR